MIRRRDGLINGHAYTYYIKCADPEHFFQGSGEGYLCLPREWGLRTFFDIILQC